MPPVAIQMLTRLRSMHTREAWTTRTQGHSEVCPVQPGLAPSVERSTLVHISLEAHHTTVADSTCS